MYTDRMPKAKDISGRIFGRLVAIQPTGASKFGYRIWHCVCDCGNTKDVPLNQLCVAKNSTGTASCGCKATEQRAKDFRPHIIKPRHGMYLTKTYKCWQGIKARCNYAKGKFYHRYGGRGIKVCDRWSVFENFLSDMGECPAGYSIERIDVNGNYETSNCKWIPLEEQVNNTRQTRLMTAFGKTMTFAQWARHVGIKRNTIEDRLRRGWSLERALTQSVPSEL
jgi:hypothetical protein